MKCELIFLILFVIFNFNSSVLAYTDNIGNTNFYLEQLKTSLTSVSGIFDNFISFTPDPTGHALCITKESMVCRILSLPELSINLQNGETVMPTTHMIVSKLFILILPLGLIFICLEAYNLILHIEGQKVKDILKRLVLAIALYLVAPYFFSLSIVFSNQLSFTLLGNTSLTGFIIRFTEVLESAPANNIFEAFFKDILSIANLGGVNPFSYLYALPVIIPLSLILLLLLFISFQFIMRFLILYFLSALYPVVFICLLHHRTVFVVKNYLKLWFTILVQQPVFILGFLLVNQVLFSIFDKGLSLQALIIFVGMLIFLASINIFAAKIWGDTYGVLIQNVSSTWAAKVLKSNLLDKPLQLSNHILSNKLTPKLIDKIDPLKNSKENQEESKEISNKILPSKSLLFNDLKSRGYGVSDLKDGKLNVSGRFYSPIDLNRQVGKIYTSQSDAIRDGVNQSAVKAIDINDLTIQDPSNKRAIWGYNSSLKTFAAENGGHLKRSGISYKSLDQKIVKNMEYAKVMHMQKGIQAFATNSDCINGDRSVTSDNLLKIHIYNDILKNKYVSN